MKIAVFVIFLISFFLETSVTTLPLVFLVLLSIAVLSKKEWVFALAFLLGIILDTFSFRTIGASSIYFIMFIFLVFLYQRKFEIATKYFVFIASFLGSFGFLLFFSSNNLIILEAVLSAIIGTVIFSLLQKFEKHKQNF